MKIESKLTDARACKLIGILLLLIMFHVPQEEARIILLLAGSIVIGIGRYKYYQVQDKEPELIKYRRAA